MSLQDKPCPSVIKVHDTLSDFGLRISTAPLKLFDLVALRAQKREQAIVSAEMTGPDDDEISVAAPEEIFDLRYPGTIAGAEQSFVEGRELDRFALQHGCDRFGITPSPCLHQIIPPRYGAARNE